MILLCLAITFILLERWQVKHIHTDYNHRIFVNDYKNGDIIVWHGFVSTVIDVKTVDIQIRRHITGLFLWPFINTNKYRKLIRAQPRI
jgi:hypothetical protein